METYGSAYTVYDPNCDVNRPDMTSYQRTPPVGTAGYNGHSVSVYVPTGDGRGATRQGPNYPASVIAAPPVTYPTAGVNFPDYGEHYQYGARSADPTEYGDTSFNYWPDSGAYRGQVSSGMYGGPLRFPAPMDLSASPQYGTPLAQTGSRGRMYRPSYGFKSRRGAFSGAAPVRRPVSPMSCEVCKVCCAGPKAFAEHQNGQRHKKRIAQDEAIERLKQSSAGETLAKSTTSSTSTSRELQCEMCGVKCTGADAYAAHLAGKAHLRTVKLHRELGKPVPKIEPVPTTVGTDQTKKQAPIQSSGVTPASNGTASGKSEEPPTSSGTGATTTSGTVTIQKVDGKSAIVDDRKAVGPEYVVEIPGTGGKGVHYQCNLCDCQFTHADAKEWHLKGRRHRLQYKQKVDPSMKVEPKSSKRSGPVNRPNDKNPIPPMPSPNNLPRTGLSFAQEQMVFLNSRFQGSPNVPFLSSLTKPNYHDGAADHRCLQAKRVSVVPTELEAQAMRTVVNVCEHALKNISNKLLQDGTTTEKDAESDSSSKTTTEAKEGEKKRAGNVDLSQEQNRLLRGVVRVGPLGKSLLLRGDHFGQLVLVCAEWPTTEVVKFVKQELVSELTEMDSNFTYTVTADPPEGRITVETSRIVKPSEKETSSAPWPTITLQLNLTSTVACETPASTAPVPDNNTNTKENEANKRKTSVASGAVKADGPSVDPTTPALTTAPEQSPGSRSHGRHLFAQGERVPKSNCLDALDAIDQAKWFQMALGKPLLGTVARILVDFMRSNEVWLKLDQFAILATLDRLYTIEMKINPPPMERQPPRGPFNQPLFGSPLPPPSPGPNFSGPRASRPPMSQSISPARVLRLFFESIASGLLLQLQPYRQDSTGSSTAVEPTTTGVNDEQPPGFFAYNMLASAPISVREEVTRSAQHCLRLIEFKKLYIVLGMEQNPISSGASKESLVGPDTDDLVDNEAEEEVVGGIKRRRSDDDEEEDAEAVVGTVTPSVDAGNKPEGKSTESTTTVVVVEADSASTQASTPEAAPSTRSAAKRTRRGR